MLAEMLPPAWNLNRSLPSTPVRFSNELNVEPLTEPALTPLMSTPVNMIDTLIKFLRSWGFALGLLGRQRPASGPGASCWRHAGSASLNSASAAASSDRDGSGTSDAPGPAPPTR